MRTSRRGARPSKPGERHLPAAEDVPGRPYCATVDCAAPLLGSRCVVRCRLRQQQDEQVLPEVAEEAEGDEEVRRVMLLGASQS